MPLNTVNLYEEHVRVPALTAPASKILPLYRARGHYGPTPTELNDQDFNLAINSEPTDSYVIPSSILAPSQEPINHHSPKRAKIVNEQPRKKVIRKVKPKRALARNKHVAPTNQEEEHPVSTFHEQFYSDVQDAGTIRKIKKPPRVEKIVDGNTEHIHTYSEEHIHKVVYDDEPKYASMVEIQPIGAMSAFNTHPFTSYKNVQLLAMASDPYQTLAVAGSMDTPSQYEYAAYNPHEVTHDHIFHDHGELPEEIDVSKDVLSIPPRVSYNRQGNQIDSGLPKRIKNKYIQSTTNAPLTDYSYYENIYSSNRVKPKKVTTPVYVSSQSENINEYKPISTYRYKDNVKSKSRGKVSTYFGKPAPDYQLKLPSNVPAPFSVSSKIIHDYKPLTQSYSGAMSGANGFSIYDDPFTTFKDSYLNNFEYDNYASSSNLQYSEDKSNNSAYSNTDRKSRKKSISTQNIRFGSQTQNTFDDNLSNEAFGENDGAPSALENVDSYDQAQFANSVSSKSYAAKDPSSSYHYYTGMAFDQQSIPEASNDNYQYAEAPITSTTSFPSIVVTPISTQQLQTEYSSNPTIKPSEFHNENEHNIRYKESDVNNAVNTTSREKYRVLKEIQTSDKTHKSRFHSNSAPSLSGTTEKSKLKYGDKI
ncbi:unnamed protein product [Parnassius apollo]|uniref:(apollo) hypothetical protein n=1 Tax=Parnassius apollo TaxID=110799 RepID=A0A8S3X7P5_PARAO|nr:unnamed protein product [Parnassius apollo]